MKIDIVTLFPGYINGAMNESVLKRAQMKKCIDVTTHDLRKYTHDLHRTVDGKPFGGGAGMVIKPEPVFECLDDIAKDGCWVVMLSPHGKPFSQKRAQQLSEKKHLIFLAGHYEGFDYRIHEHLVDEEISVGDFVTMGGEAPTLCVIEATVRLIPGVLGNEESIQEESFQDNGLEYPQYTRPREYRNLKVPEVLVSGHHEEVRKWRKEQSEKITKQKRPDLI